MSENTSKKAQQISVVADQWRTTVDAIKDAICLTDAAGKIVRCNKAMANLVGRPFTEIIGRTCWEQVFGTSDPMPGGSIARLQETRQRETLVLPMGDRWLEVTTDPTFNASGGLCGAVHVISDITELKRMKEKMSIFAELLDAAPASIAVHDLDGNFIFINKRMLESHGFSEEEFLSLKINELDVPETAALFSPRLQELADRREASFEVSHFRKDGSILPLLVNAKVAKWGDKDVVLSVATDITERIKAEVELLRQSEARYRTLFSEAIDGICLADAQTGMIIDVNHALETLVGRDRVELIGQHQSIMHPPAGDKKGFSPTFEHHLTDKHGNILETQVVTKTGEIREVEIKANSLHLAEGEMLQGMFRDITWRKQAEEDVKRLKGQLELILQSAGEGILGLDLEGIQRFVNPAAAEKLGYKVEELIDQPSHSMWHHSKADGTPYPEDECPIYKACRNGAIYSRDDEVFWRKDGTSFPVRYTSTPIRQDDKLTGTVVVFRDITERKNAESELWESKEQLAQILNSTAEGIYGLDLMGKCTFCNPSCVRTLGYHDENDLIGKNMHDIIHGKKADGTLHSWDECVVHKALNKGEYIHSDKEFLHRADGTNFPAEYWIHPIYKDNKVIGAVVAFVDITKRATLENQLRHAMKMEAMGQFAGGIAHDFNNILSAIIGYGDLSLMNLGKNNPLRPNIESMLEAADKAAHLTKEILAFGRKQVLDKNSVDLNIIIRKVKKFLVRVIGEDVECITQLQKEPVWVLADAHQLEQVFMNLAINARDAMPEGGSFTVTTEQIMFEDEFITIFGYGKPGMYALITVTDTGTGIDAATRQKVFEPFFTTKDVGKGTGLGLSVMYGIIDQHGGYINVDSEPGMGTTFNIYLPAITAEVVEEKTAPAAEHPESGTETILVAEDDEALRKLMMLVLRQFGYEVIVAIDGEDAVKKFMENKERIQLLLFDIVMPKKSGKEAYDEIRKIRPDIKIIFASGYSPDLVQQKISLDNKVSIIMKPVLTTDLLKKVRSLLDENKS